MELGNHRQFGAASERGDLLTFALGDPLPGADNLAGTLWISLASVGAGVWEYDPVAGTVLLSPESRRIFGLPHDHSGMMSQVELLELVDVMDVDSFRQWVDPRGP